MATLDTGYSFAGVAKTYTTQNAAYTAGSNYDNAEIYYYDTIKGRGWAQAFQAASATKKINVKGMIDNRGVCMTPIATSGAWYYMSGDLTGSTQIVIENITFIGLYTTVRWYNTGSSGAGGGFKVKNCAVIGGMYPFYLQDGEDNYDFENVCVVGVIRCVLCTTNVQDFTMVNCTIINTPYIWIYGTSSTITNTVFVGSGYYSTANATWNNCVFSGSAPAGTLNSCHANQRWDTLSFWGDAMLAAGGEQGLDYRVTADSFLIGEGTVTGAPAIDCDGNTRANPPTVGWHEGTTNPYEYPAGGSGGRRPRMAVAA